MTVRKLSRRTQAFFVSCLKSSLQSFVLLSSIYPYICLYVYLSTNPFPFSSLASSLVYRSHSSPYYHFPPQTYGRPAGKKSTGSYCHSLLLPLLPSLSLPLISSIPPSLLLLHAHFPSARKPLLRPSAIIIFPPKFPRV